MKTNQQIRTQQINHNRRIKTCNDRRHVNRRTRKGAYTIA